jgi:hypothetical protein
MKNKINFLALCFTLLTNQSAYSYGSYLFCTNSAVSGSNSTLKGIGWNWAKGTNGSHLETAAINNYQNLVRVYPKGTWINGSSDLNTSYNYYLLIDSIFENQNAAINFCEALKQKCQSDWGPTFTGIGVSTWDIPHAAWGSVTIKYKLSHNRYDRLACKNWKHTKYEPLYYTPDEYMYTFMPLMH